MILQTEIDTLKTTLSNLKSTIREKGQTVADTDTVVSLPPKIDLISNLAKNNYSANVLKDVVEGTIEYLFDTTLIYVRPYCFTGCDRLEKARFTNLRKICRQAFEDCFAFKTLVLDTPAENGIVCLENPTAFKNTYLATALGEIYVTDSLLDKYKTDSMWAVFKDKFKPISQLHD